MMMMIAFVMITYYPILLWSRILSSLPSFQFQRKTDYSQFLQLPVYQPSQSDRYEYCRYLKLKWYTLFLNICKVLEVFGVFAFHVVQLSRLWGLLRNLINYAAHHVKLIFNKQDIFKSIDKVLKRLLNQIFVVISKKHKILVLCRMAL